jgi:hypothetical protein
MMTTKTTAAFQYKTREERLAMSNAEYEAYSQAHSVQMWADLRRDELRHEIVRKLVVVFFFALIVMALVGVR